MTIHAASTRAPRAPRATLQRAASIPASAPASQPRRTPMRAIAGYAAIASIILAGTAAVAVSQGLLPGARGQSVAIAPAERATAAPGSAAQAKAYTVSGFRSARFGMSRDEVMAAIAKDFGVAASSVKPLENTVEGTTALVAEVGTIAPGPGKATVTYILGRNSHKLVHVNVVWYLDATAQSVDRNLMATAGLKLQAVFDQYTWEKGKSVRNVPTGANSVVMLLAIDNAGGAIELRADGLSYRTQKDGQSVDSPTPTGPVRLRLSYAQNATAPDIAQIKPGQF